jgi:hypothetical protein
MNADEAARLRNALNQTSETNASLTWQPAVNDMLIGVVTARDSVSSKYADEPQEHLAIETEEGGMIHIYGRHVMLARLIEELDPKPGDRVAIQRLADLPGKRYRVYKMVVERGDGEDVPF